MSSTQTTIQISRSRYIERDRSIAVLRLDEHYFYVGEPVMVRYYLDPEQQIETDTLLAVGIKEGNGKDCYKVVSMGGLELIRDVVYDLPDVSQLVHGELYLYQNPQSKEWYYVYEVDGDRQIEKINSAPTTFVNIEDRYRWFWRDGILKREDDFYSTSELDEIINEFINLVSPPKVEVESIYGYLFEQGTTQDITFKIHIIDLEGKDITKNCDILIDGTSVALKTGNLWTDPKQTISHDYEVEARFIVNKKEFSTKTTVKIRFGYFFYYGCVSPDWTITEQNVRGLQNIELKSRQNFKWTGIDLEKQKVVFAYPKNYGPLKHIFDDNNLCYIPDYTISTLRLSTGEEYYVYVKDEEVQVKDFTQWFIFAEEDTTEEIRFGKYDDVLRAWDRQNLGDGLVVLDSSGKIPETLIPSSEYPGAYIEIENFVTEYPQYDITPGMLWYNTETKKIFKGVSPEAGILEDPKENKIYIKMSDRSMYVWKASEMVSIGGSVSAVKINNLSEIL